MPAEELTTPTPPNPPPSPSAPSAASAPTEPPASKVDRALVAELDALRRQVAALPDPDEVERLRSRAALADEVEANLPEWRSQLAAAVDQQRQEGENALAKVQQDLSRARLDQQVAAAAFAAGCSEVGWPVLRGALGEVQPAEDGSLTIATADGPQPLAEALQTLSDHPVYSACFKSRYGSGGGSRGNISSRAVPGMNLSNMSTDQRFKAAFGRNR